MVQENSTKRVLNKGYVGLLETMGGDEQMNKRDLKADLKIAENMPPLNTSEFYRGIHVDTALYYIEAQESWPYAVKQALAEKERADKAEALLEELRKEMDIALEELNGQCEYCAFRSDCAKHDNNGSDIGFAWWTDCEDWEWHHRSDTKYMTGGRDLKEDSCGCKSFVCAWCGKPIEGFHVALAREGGNIHFCDHGCLDSYQAKEKRNCDYCGHKMLFGENLVTYNGAFCDKECEDKYLDLPTKRELIARISKLETLVRDLEVALERMKWLSREGFMINEVDDHLLEQSLEKIEEVLTC